MHPIWTLLRCAVVASLVFFLAAWAMTAFAQPACSDTVGDRRIA